jgi:hypothetical protein
VQFDWQTAGVLLVEAAACEFLLARLGVVKRLPLRLAGRGPRSLRTARSTTPDVLASSLVRRRRR